MILNLLPGFLHSSTTFEMVNNVSGFFLFLMPWAMVNLENPGKRLKHVQWVFFLKFSDLMMRAVVPLQLYKLLT